MIRDSAMFHSRDIHAPNTADVRSQGEPGTRLVAKATEPENLKGKPSHSQKVGSFRKFARLVSLSLRQDSVCDESEKCDSKLGTSNGDIIGVSHGLVTGKEIKQTFSCETQNRHDCGDNKPVVKLSRKKNLQQSSPDSSSSDENVNFRDLNENSSRVRARGKNKKVGNCFGVSRNVSENSFKWGDENERKNVLNGESRKILEKRDRERRHFYSEDFEETNQYAPFIGDVRRREEIEKTNRDQRRVQFEDKTQVKAKDADFRKSDFDSRDKNNLKNASDLKLIENADERWQFRGVCYGPPYLAELKEKLSSLQKSLEVQVESCNLNVGYDNVSHHVNNRATHSRDTPPCFNYKEKSPLIELENYIHHIGDHREYQAGTGSGSGDTRGLDYPQKADNTTHISQQKNNHITMAMEGNYSDGGSIDGEGDLYPNRQTVNNTQQRENHSNHNNDSANQGRRYKNQENGDVIDSSYKGMKGDPREISQKQGGHMTGGDHRHGHGHGRMHEPAYYSDVDMSEGEIEEGMNDRRTDKRRQRLHNNNSGDSHRRGSRESGHGPNVIVTQANVHLSQEEMEDLDCMEDRGPRQRQPSGGDRQNESHIRRNDRKYQSHNNLSRPMTNEDREMEKVSKSASQYYTPRPRRKQRQGKYDSRQSSEDELRDLGNHIDPRVTHPMSRAGSMADVGRGGDFTMPKSKMGSFQDFKPIKHSQSSQRVSTDKGRIINVIGVVL